MSTKQVQEGAVLSLTAPSGGVTSGQTVVVGGHVGIALETAAEGATFALAVRGVHTVTKVGSSAWAEGEIVYWDGGNSRWTKVVADGLIKAGVCVEAVGSGAGATTGKVLLCPQLYTMAGPTVAMAAGTNLTAVPGSFADEAAVQTYLVTLRAETEARLDALELFGVAARLMFVENGWMPNT